ncbi:metal-dependent hydrolase [Salipaludibacillus sp. HK11]|uniref:metal-dependent hydrolase n=1 Tax=Salipaludibacillus sp. HK11 TaxID=3394320 RepID=UPI0039FDDB36
MRYYTHITTSLSAAILIGEVASINVPLTSTWVVSGVILGSVLPDIDESRSWIGQRIPFLSSTIKALFGHRGLTHSGIVLAIMIAAMVHFSHEFLLGLFFGVALHIIGDFFSVGGIPLLYPFSKKRSQIGIYRTGTWSEALIFIGSFGFLIYSFL